MSEENQKVNRELNRITGNIPQRLQEGITKKEVDTSEEDYARKVMHDPKTRPDTRNKLAHLIDKGAFRREEIVIDERKVRELDRYHDAKVKQAIREGRIPHPDKVKNDSWLRERQARMQKR